MSKTILWILVTAIMAAMLVIAPNTLWLARSSAVVLARAPDAVACRTEMPLLNRLFLADYLS